MVAGSEDWDRDSSIWDSDTDAPPSYPPPPVPSNEEENGWHGETVSEPDEEDENKIEDEPNARNFNEELGLEWPTTTTPGTNVKLKNSNSFTEFKQFFKRSKNNEDAKETKNREKETKNREKEMKIANKKKIENKDLLIGKSKQVVDLNANLNEEVESRKKVEAWIESTNSKNTPLDQGLAAGRPDLIQGNA